MVDFTNVKGISIPEGQVKQISKNGVVLWNKSKLPSEYQEVEWIKGHGNQFIDLEISASGGILCYYGVVYDSDYTSLSIDGGGAIAAHNSYYPYGRCQGYYKPQANSWELGYGETYPQISGTIEYGKKYDIEYCTFYDEGYLNVDGVRKITASHQTVTSTNVYAFGTYWQVANPTSPCVVAKLYYAQIYKKINNELTLVRDLVPCYRKSDNEIGLYDMITEKFYTNIRGGKFTCYPEPNYNLPSEYQEVEYIQSTGTQYINLLTQGDNNTKIELTLTPFNTNSEATIIGARDDYSRNAMSLTLYSYGWYCYGQTEGRLSASFQNNTKYDIIIDNNIVKYKMPTDINYTNISNFGQYTFKTKDMYMFADNFNTQTRYYTQCQLFKLKIYKYNTLIKNFIPCYRKSDNEIGLYEVMEQKFYTNSGTGAFIKGNDVNE